MKGYDIHALTSLYIAIPAMLEAEKRRKREAFRRMTPEEQHAFIESEKSRIAKEKERAELSRLETKRQSLISKRVCPSCGEKGLLKGRKDKKHNYMRIWDCPVCNDRHYR